MTRRRNNNGVAGSHAPSPSPSSSSTSTFNLKSFINSSQRQSNNSNVLILLLSVGILIWVILCLHIHVTLSYQPLGPRLRKRFMIHQHQHGQSANNNNNNLNNNMNNNNDDWNYHYPTNEEGLAACLLVNDENPRLPEWIAYHYHTLPLRSLIVAVDPASRSSPANILNAWREVMGLDVQIWEEKRYMPYGGDGACDKSNPKMDCLKVHRKRQQNFVRACMREFKANNKTWVLLTDVDEYITFNTVHHNDPPPPMDAAPEGIPTIGNWTWSRHAFTSMEGKHIDTTVVRGQISGLPDEGWHGKKNGQPKTTLPLINPEDEIFYGAYGSIFTDEADQKWFLRDDHVFLDAVDIPYEQVLNLSVPIIKDAHIANNILHGTTLNGKVVEIPTVWRESPVKIKTMYGGHMIYDTNGKVYYIQRENYLWSPHLASHELLEIRQRLPTVDSGKTVLDVLVTEMQRLGSYANETLGPCLAMPRVLYGSMEDDKNNVANSDWKDMAPNGFKDEDFMTLRYRWHSLPDTRVNKYQKTIIDVSRIPRKSLKGEAENIHTPIKYYCREKQPPRYSTSPFRVNHYLDSFEAYSYRNDARADKRQCRKCYNEKGVEASRAYDDDIRPWLASFVKSVGEEKAKTLLAGAGNFVSLS